MHSKTVRFWVALSHRTVNKVLGETEGVDLPAGVRFRCGLRSHFAGWGALLLRAASPALSVKVAVVSSFTCSRRQDRRRRLVVVAKAEVLEQFGNSAIRVRFLCDSDVRFFFCGSATFRVSGF